MYKLVMLFALVAVAVAKPTVLHTTAVVGSLPTTISQQSNSIIHNAALVSPIVQATPVLASPIVAAAPVSGYAAAPVVGSYAAPFLGGGFLGGHY